MSHISANDLKTKGISAIDTVVSVPCYFTDAQRRAVKDAAAIGGLACLRVLNDGTATALSYGIFKGAKKEFPEGKETPIMFLDMGSSQFSATVAVFSNTSLRVLATSSDSSFGGRDIDAILAQDFAAVFSKKTGAGDAYKNKKARLKLLAAAEKAKAVLMAEARRQALALELPSWQRTSSKADSTAVTAWMVVRRSKVCRPRPPLSRSANCWRMALSKRL